MVQSSNPHEVSRLQTVRGIRYFLDGSPPDTQVPAQVRGVVVRKWSRGAVAGRWVLELTGQINVIVSRDRLDLADISGMTVGRRVIVAGSARISSRGQLILEPNHVEIVPNTSLGVDGAQGVSSLNVVPEYVVTSFLLARLRSIATETAARHGYRQFEPSYISNPLVDRRGEPLSVSFPGWGGPADLAISPAPQLLRVLLETGEQRVFAIARCFSCAYRDGFSSAEKLALVARQINASRQEAAELAIEILQDLLNEGDTAIGGFQWTRSEWAHVEVSDFSMRSVTVPSIEWMSSPEQKEATEIELFRVLYPPGVAVAEGDVATWASNVRIGGVTIHLERLVSLLSPSRLAAIRDLGDSVRRTAQ